MLKHKPTNTKLNSPIKVEKQIQLLNDVILVYGLSKSSSCKYHECP